MTTVIFDMDGVLIDSEPYWREVEKAVFLKEGILITDEMCYDVQGLKAEHVVETWVKQFPHLQHSVTDYVTWIQEGVQQKIRTEGKPMDGVIETLEYFKAKGYKMLVASSSNYLLINTVIDKLGIRQYFDVIHSSQDEKLGKPYPDVFLHAAEHIGSRPEDCLVIEDSGNGVRAGKAAGMTVIAIPAPTNYHNPVFEIADYKLRSMTEVSMVI
ncbi:MAG: hexitol phosphatase HxpB [Bacteroidales bacterium]|nr:hexitol phosphatase HxpB [Bacteroidales bacterium]